MMMASLSKLHILKLSFASTIIIPLVSTFEFNVLATSKNSTLFDPNNIEITNLGKEVYNTISASCRGANLEGQPNWSHPISEGMIPAPPYDETSHTWHHNDDLLFGITKYGIVEFSGLKNHKTDMLLYKNILTDTEIIAVLSYIKCTWSVGGYQPIPIGIMNSQLGIQCVKISTC